MYIDTVTDFGLFGGKSNYGNIENLTNEKTEQRLTPGEKKELQEEESVIIMNFLSQEGIIFYSHSHVSPVY